VIDLRVLRSDPDRVRASQRARGDDPGLVDALLAADEARRAAVTRADGLRGEQKAASSAVKTASKEERPAVLERAKALAAEVKAAEVAQSEAEAALRAAHLAVPNVVQDGVPPGGEQDFSVLQTVGQVPTYDFAVKDHLDIGTALGAIDTERGAKVSGSRFAFLTGWGALLELALVNLSMAAAVEAGFTPVIAPALVRPEAMEGTGFLGAHADEVYRLANDDLYLVGTSEVPLAAYHSGRCSTSCRCATPASRRASAARPAATARTPAGSSACTSSTRWRCSPTSTWPPPSRSTCGCCRTRWRSCPCSSCRSA
jgi:seryl-tRNA synthetase